MLNCGMHRHNIIRNKLYMGSESHGCYSFRRCSRGFEGDIVTMGGYTVGQYYIVFLTFFVSLTLMILVFTISMVRFKKQEKKLLAEDAE